MDQSNNSVLGELIPFMIGVGCTSIGFYLVNFCFKPVFAFRDAKIKVTTTLSFYANVYLHSHYNMEKKDLIRECSSELRKLACEVNGLNQGMPKSKIFRKISQVPAREKLNTAYKLLAGLSNYMLLGGRDKKILEFRTLAKSRKLKKIEDILGICIDENLTEEIKVSEEVLEEIKTEERMTKENIESESV